MPVDYDEEGKMQPKYADGYNITYFGDRPFQGYSGTIIGDKYIVKIQAPESIHAKLQEQPDVRRLSNTELTDALNERFDRVNTFEEWDGKFRC